MTAGASDKKSSDMIDDILEELDRDKSRAPARRRDDASIKSTDDFTVFKAALEQAYVDGIITEDEHKMLDNLRSLLNISDEQVSILKQEAEKRYFSPRIAKYKAVLEQAYSGGRVSSEQEAMLEQVRAHLEITDAEHRMLEANLTKRKPKPDFDIYRTLLQQAWVDGIITAEERAMLDLLKENLGIPEDEAKVIEEEIIQSLPQREAAPPKAASKAKGAKRVPKKRGAEPEVEDMTGSQLESQRWMEEGERIWAASNGSEAEAMHVVDCFNKAISLDPDNFMAWSNKGVILKKINKPREAIECYDRAIEIKPDFANAWYNRGVLLGGLGKVEDAIECFNEVLAINPENQMALRDRNALMRVLAIRKGASR